MMSRALAVASLLAGAATLTLAPERADACGCFAAPPTVPVVQAGERILFSHDNGEITAHIQIQYEGEASEFGWLLPLPSVPEIELGVEELFVQLINSTQPQYRLTFEPNGACFQNRANAPASFESADGATGGQDDDNLVEIQGSIGPFDFVVLRAENKDEMLTWLNDNRYVVPADADSAIDNYIYEGAFFMALKLRKGTDVGDIQPVVVKYKSDLPMIPLVLTSIGANPDMGVQVWVLGDSRAIPRNYRHTVLNEEYIDWFSAGSNYNEVIINATNEAPEGQSFVTEYAGTSAVMQNLLNFEGRFGDAEELKALTDAAEYVTRLRTSGFPWTSPLISALQNAIEMPDALIAKGFTTDDYYGSLDFFLNSYRERNPEDFEGVDLSFDPVALTDVLWERIVTPTLAAGALFDQFPYLTRMYTTLSPDEMTRDPVFSFNANLPEVSNIHEATFTFDCDDPSSGVLRLPDGRRFFIDNQRAWVERDRVNVPFSRRIEVLRDEGAPEVVVDNATRVSPSDTEPSGCSSLGGRNPSATGAWLAVLALAGFIRRRRRA